MLESAKSSALAAGSSKSLRLRTVYSVAALQAKCGVLYCISRCVSGSMMLPLAAWCCRQKLTIDSTVLRCAAGRWAS